MIDPLSTATRPSAVVLAAGGSTRFGTENPKQLFEIDGEWLVSRTCSRLRNAGIRQIIVVVGYRGADVAAAVRPLGVEIVVNDDWEQGQSTSVRAGLARVAADAPGALFAPCDQPYLDLATLRRLLGTFSQQPDKIVRPVAAGRPGAPVIFPRSLFSLLEALTGDEGGRQLLSELGEEVVDVEIPSPRPLLDLDSFADAETTRMT